MGIIDFEFVDTNINTSCIEKVWNANVKNVAGALSDLEFELPIEFGIAASAQGSPALSDTDLYNVDTDISYGFSGRTSGNIGSIKVIYEQIYLDPPVGSDNVRWRHTTPLKNKGHNPNDYSEVVNAGNVIMYGDKSVCNFNPPAWSSASIGYKDVVKMKLPDIVGSAFSRHNIIRTI